MQARTSPQVPTPAQRPANSTSDVRSVDRHRGGCVGSREAVPVALVAESLVVVFLVSVYSVESVVYKSEDEKR